MDWTNKYFLGILTAVLVVFLTKRVAKNRSNGKVDRRTKRPLYRADHSILNIPLPPQSLWMNMGLWKDTEDFPTACRALLEEVLKSAQVLQDGVSDSNNNLDNTLSIIDLGFGCGDQCLYIKDALDHHRQRKIYNPWRRRIKAYVGITLEKPQLCIAQERLGLKQPNTNTEFEIYCADAARPASWTSDIRNAVSLACQNNDETGDHENWLLGLDTLYHFQPSRWPVIEYAKREWGSSLMAYDLCIAENLSTWQRTILRLMAFFGQSPFANWVTIPEYREQLVMAGYAPERVEIRDISEHVFGPLAGFMKKREVELDQYGLSIGRYRYAGKMFGWWGRTGVVRGCIIVARK
ncbi:hypothetical protein BP5796_13205 [Coleophoma crateriformis]|uniref:Uncharacterized protein n=1 Tax=Coleophoma crateriformis TaxID=565419 RepID=A0A3D8Q3A9_9HELO|nr:hypothetical protein BP5796_13205 [Coleophoma crateriformis]